MTKPLAPIRVPWASKGLSSAKVRTEHLPDGRLRFSIEHDVLKGVTPAMLVWWFNNMDGTCSVDGVDHPRYRVWHPRDHHSLTYLRAASDGRKFGPGALIRIREFFGADPRCAIDVVDVVDHLDERGFVHRNERFGQTAARMDYTMRPVANGTQYDDVMTVGIEGAKIFNRLVRPLIKSDSVLSRWPLHNIEEVGHFEHFLPQLYRAAERLGVA